MTTARQLYSLQELDLSLESITARARETELELSSQLALERIEERLREAQERLQELQVRQRLQKLETEGLRDRSTRLNERLYNGDVTNPRDLESLQQEANNVLGSLELQDAELLELETQVEECQATGGALERELTAVRDAWEGRQKELNDQMGTLTAERESIAAQKIELRFCSRAPGASRLARRCGQ